MKLSVSILLSKVISITRNETTKTKMGTSRSPKTSMFNDDALNTLVDLYKKVNAYNSKTTRLKNMK